MLSVDHFTIQKHQGKYEDRPLKSSLYFDGKDINLKVSGYVIDRQFTLPHYYLLLLHWDCPFEEGYEIIVINKQFKIVGTHSFTPSYNSYLLSRIKQVSQNTYALVFNECEYFALTINYPKQRFFSKVITMNCLTI